MWRHVAFVRTDMSEERITSIITAKNQRVGNVSSNEHTNRLVVCWLLLTLFPARWCCSPRWLRRYAASESRFLQVTRHIIQEDGILHSHWRENLKSYINSWVFNISLEQWTWNWRHDTTYRNLFLLCSWNTQLVISALRRNSFSQCQVHEP
jgi:hypothetical protein